MEVNSNIDQVIDRLRRRAAMVRDLSVPVATATSVVRDSIVARFTGDNDWPANSPFTVAQKGSSRPGIDRGALRNSITASTNGNTGNVSTNLRYAKWFNDGTGIFAGHSEWAIHPKSKKFLAFKGPGGEMFFARKVIARGQPARKFMEIDDATNDRVKDVFRAWIASLGSNDAAGT